MMSPVLPKHGRPRLDVQTHRIGLRIDVYSEWLVQKDLAGMSDRSHSEFASYLLQIAEPNRLSHSSNTVSQLPSECKWI